MARTEVLQRPYDSSYWVALLRESGVLGWLNSFPSSSLARLFVAGFYIEINTKQMCLAPGNSRRLEATFYVPAHLDMFLGGHLERF